MYTSVALCGILSLTTHSLSISVACGCLSFLALSTSRKRSLSRPSASPSLSEISVWCSNGNSFFSFSASWWKQTTARVISSKKTKQKTIYLKCTSLCLSFSVCSRVLTTASISSDRRMSFSTWSAFFCIWAISKAKLLAWFLQGEEKHHRWSHNHQIRSLINDNHFSVPPHSLKSSSAESNIGVYFWTHFSSFVYELKSIEMLQDNRV